MTENGERRPITGSKIVTKIQKFEDLEVWKEGVRLSVEIYKSLGECKDYRLRDQIQKSTVSIPTNIFEGFERKGNKEFIQFLYIAKGSCSELRTQLYIAAETGSIEKNYRLEIYRKD